MAADSENPIKFPCYFVFGEEGGLITNFVDGRRCLCLFTSEDAVKRFPFILILLLLWAGVRAETPATATKPPQVKANDGSYDNGPALSYYAQNSIPVPAGVYYVSSTIETGNYWGGKLVGAGRTCEGFVERSYWIQTEYRDGKPIEKPLQQPVTIILWNGKPTDTLLHIQRQGFYVADLALQGAFWKADWSVKGKGALVDIEQPNLSKGENRPAGNIAFERVTFLNAAIAIRTLKSTHCDGLSFDHCVSNCCDIVYQSNEEQSVECVFNHLTVKDGCQRIFDMRYGGRFICRDLGLSGQCSEAILSLGDKDANTGPDENANHYVIDGLQLDNKVGNPNEKNTTPVCIVKEQTDNHPALVKVRGFAANIVTPTKPPVVQLNPKSRINVKIEQVGGAGIVWPIGGGK